MAGQELVPERKLPISPISALDSNSNPAAQSTDHFNLAQEPEQDFRIMGKYIQAVFGFCFLYDDRKQSG
jgi:hypothetical protein